jgi:hypothetical protein
MKQALFLCILFLSTYTFSASKGCNQVTKELLKDSAPLTSLEFFHPEVELLWYPRTNFVIFTHTEIKIGNNIYDPLLGVHNIKDFDKAVRSAYRNSWNSFFRFKLSVTPRELANLEEFIRLTKGQRRLQTCVGGSCKMLKQFLGLRIPPPFSQIPTLAALYLTIAHKLGYKKILKVEFVGNHHWRTLLGIGPLSELSYAAQLAATGAILIVWAVDYLGDINTFIVPITKNKKDNETKLDQSPASLLPK